MIVMLIINLMMMWCKNKFAKFQVLNFKISYVGNVHSVHGMFRSFPAKIALQVEGITFVRSTMPHMSLSPYTKHSSTSSLKKKNSEYFIGASGNVYTYPMPIPISNAAVIASVSQLTHLNLANQILLQKKLRSLRLGSFLLTCPCDGFHE